MAPPTPAVASLGLVTAGVACSVTVLTSTRAASPSNWSRSEYGRILAAVDSRLCVDSSAEDTLAMGGKTNSAAIVAVSTLRTVLFLVPHLRSVCRFFRERV